MKTVKVKGARVLVRPFKLEEIDETYKKVKAAGLEVPNLREKRLEEAALDQGTVVAVGDLAWYDWGDGQPWASIGDKVLWARHAGKTVEIDGEKHLILNDEDVVAVIED